MLQTLQYALDAIGPILLIIGLGFLVGRFGRWDRKFYKTLNQICFHLFLPLNLFCSVYAIEDLSAVNWKLLGFMVAGILLCVGMGVAAARFVKNPSQKGVIAQAAFRSNQAVLGLPLANALGGEAAMGFASVASAIGVPLFNVLAVSILTAYAHSGQKQSVRQILAKISANPLIRAAGLGLILVALRQTGLVPAFFLRERLGPVWKAIYDLGKIASPVMLFVLGACLDFGAAEKFLPQLSLGIFLRLVAAPVLVIGFALLLRQPLGLTTLEMPSFVAMCASPVAVSSAVMVQEIGGDDQLASQMVVWSSVLSMGTIFVLTCCLRAIGAL